MSVSVTIRTKKALQPDDILKSLAEKGEKNVVTSMDFPSVKFGTHLEAIRGIEVNQEDNGYEVRVCSFSSTADYQLFARTIAAMMELTGGEAFEIDDDECKVENPLEQYDAKWIQQQHETSLSVTKAFVKNYGSPVVFWGLFCHFCVGPKLLEGFNISLTEKYKKGKMKQLQNYLRSVQWHFANLKGTSTRMAISDPNNENHHLSISAIYIENGKVVDFDYISEASLFSIFDMDDKSEGPVLIPFKEMWKILPEGVFRPIDEWQYERIGDIDVDMVREMIATARRYQPDDIHYKPTFPGTGYDEKQNTFILMWNPAISSMSLERHNSDVKNMLTEYFNWSVWEYDKAKCGDRFFLVRVGEGNTGVVMSGVFDTHPYEAADWSGKGRRTFYMDMVPNLILNPETAPMVTTKELQEAIPSFDWSGGHSGRMLTEDEARKIENLWHQFMEKHKGQIDGVNINAILSV